MAPPTITVGCGRSHSRACLLFFPFVSTSDSIGLDSVNGLASAWARCVESLLLDNKFSKAFFLCRRLNFMDMFPFLLCRVSSFALVPKSHVPPFLPYCTRRRTVVRRLIVCLFLWYSP
jgi:hypothetical protein